MTHLPAYLLPNGSQAICLTEGNDYTLLLDGKPVAGFSSHQPESDLTGLSLTLKDLITVDFDPAALYALLTEVFRSDRTIKKLTLKLTEMPQLTAALHRSGLVQTLTSSDTAIAWRSAFWQLPGNFLPAPASGLFPLRYMVSNHHQHPIRPPKPQGEVYRRYFPELKETLTLRTIDPELDLAVFHEWMNQPRVNKFWEMAGDRQQHANYLNKLLADPHSHPLFACFDGEPFGYFEFYWAKEDRIAPFYDAQDYDRGFHFLIGNNKFRGAVRFRSWLRSLAHYLFTDEPRCQRLVAEPRIDNVRLIDHLQRHGFIKRKEFDFPHKRAALVVMEREVFFDQSGL